ncbi:MAG: hypothetical protein HOV81_10690 [Kofleriaceae bacterium]|nr:hypothetical protein [Kofleriaceae bacterium]
MSRAIGLVLVGTLGVIAHAADASPRSDPTMGRSVFTGATMPHATSIDLNPAAIGLGEQNEVYGAALLALDQYSITPRRLDINTGMLTDEPHVGEALFSPGGMIAFIYHTDTDGKVTIGGQFRTAPAQQFLEGDAFKYHVNGGSYRTWAATVAASFRVTSKVFLGVSLDAQKSFMKMAWARDTALAAGNDPARGIASDCGGAACGVANPGATELYSIDASSDLFSASNVLAVNLGVVISLWRDTWLGIAYHSPPGLALQNQLVGDMEVVQAPRDGGGNLSGGTTVYVQNPASVDAEFRTRLPFDLDAHVGFRWEDQSRLSNYDVRSYGSAFATANIPEWQPRALGYHDSFALWTGVEQIEFGQPLRFGGRIGLERSALDNSRTSALAIAPTSLTLDGGMQVRFNPNWTFQLTYGFQYFPKVNVTDSAFDPRDQLACEDAGFDYNNPACRAVRSGYAIPTAAGEYTRFAHAARIAIRYHW